MKYNEKMKTLTLEDIAEIRKLAKKEDRIYFSLLDEVEEILKTHQQGKWNRVENDDKVVGELWEQEIGTFKYKDTIHVFTYMYLPKTGWAVRTHGHNEIVHGVHVKKGKELYIFYVPAFTVRMEFCGKDEEHELYNAYGAPIHVLSVKIKGRG